MSSENEILKHDNSKGLIIDYLTGDPQHINKGTGRKAIFDTKSALKVIRNDPVVMGAIISLTDKVIETPYQVLGRDKRSKKNKLEDKLRDLRFEKVLRKVVSNMLLYGNAFVEIVKQGGQITDLNVLETNNMDIITKDNGDVVEYRQVVGSGGKGNGTIIWQPDRIVHYKLTDITTNAWAEVDIEALYDTVLIKDSIRSWIKWFFQTNQSRGLYIIKNASEGKIKDFLSLLKANERDITRPVILEGEVTYQVLRSFADEGKTLNDLLLWANSEILALLQVPPITIGFPDMSGRANSSEQQLALNTRVNSIHKLLEESTTFDLFPKMGFEKAMFEFGALDDKTMKAKMEVVQIMKNAGFTNEAIEEWLRQNDIFFETKNVFNDPMEMMQQMNPNKTITGQDEDAPSRQRKGEMEGNKQKDQPTTRDDQLMKHTIIEPCDQYGEVFKDE